jgi:hypothetical protein
MELNLAVEASRSSFFGALLRSAPPSARHSVVDFLRGLSRDEMECIAEFQGAYLLEGQLGRNLNPYRFMAEFFDPSVSERWISPEDRAHKTFVVLGWLEKTRPWIRLSIGSQTLSARSLRAA